MKTPSYQIIGIGIGIAAVCAWMFLVEKEVEKYKGYYIWKIGGKFVAERLKDERKTNPRLDTIEACRAWIDADILKASLKDAANSIPWG